MRKTKELNTTFNNKTLNQNIQDINATKQRFTQSRTDFQRNINETIKLKEHIAKELRHVEICEHLKDVPLGLQYDQEIWNEYFLNQVQIFQSKMKAIKDQFEQLEDYFKAYDHDKKIDLPSKIALNWHLFVYLFPGS
jgi:hypothetical protein